MIKIGPMHAITILCLYPFTPRASSDTINKTIPLAPSAGPLAHFPPRLAGTWRSNNDPLVLFELQRAWLNSLAIRGRTGLGQVELAPSMRLCWHATGVLGTDTKTTTIWRIRCLDAQAHTACVWKHHPLSSASRETCREMMGV